MRRSAGAPPACAQIPRLADDNPAPLSFAQERLWFLEQLHPESAVYNLCRTVRIGGRLDLRALQSSLSELQRRHESLRTRFVMVDGKARQIIDPPQELSLAPVDLRRSPASKRKPEATRVIAENTRRPFDLVHGPLLRACLLRLSDQEHVLAVIIHHMVADAWSMGILFRELWILYEAERAGRADRTLAEVPCRYRDYAAWQRARLDDVLKPQLDYWKEMLADVAMLDLPGDRPRPAAPSFRGAKVAIELSTSLTSALNELSQTSGATLFMTLLAAIQVLLYRWSGQDDIAVGTPVANRHRPELENIVGLFVSTLVMRGDLSGAPSFRELLARIREVCLGAHAHESAPFELLVQELSPKRGLGRHPLFQAMLVLQNTPSHSASPAGLTLEPIEADSGASPLDLSLYLRERRGRLIGYFEYATDLFDRETIERMAGHFQNLLQSIVAEPDRSIATLPLLSAAEKKQLLVEWNDTAAPYPRNSCIHQLFEAQVERTPGALALECGEQKITYRELNERANTLGHELRQLGVGPERLVGVLAERSVETIAAILAILKAGAAYVPFDPRYPKQRLRFMLADTQIKVLLAQRKFADHLDDFSGTLLAIDDLLRGAPDGAANLPARTDGESGAYVIYTSGSTGTPKGVVALHRGGLNRFAWMWKTYPFEPGEKSCQKTSLSFVDSVWEIFGALLQGVPTVLIPDAIAKDARLLVDELASRGVTRLLVVPSLLKEIIEHGADLPRRLAHLKYCFSSGEALSKDLADRFRQALPECRLINLYGSSEVAGDVTYYEVGSIDDLSTIPLGRPIANSQIYLLDDHLQPVPIGVRGELYAGGENLARGYLHQPELTAEKFIANPFSAEKGARMYRTGDLARYRADGNIEFLGRSDYQVKIRGCRVELGEIELTLAMHPAVRECLVTVHAATSETDNRKSAIQNLKSATSLVAYVVPRHRPPSPAALRSFLKQKLPDYMLPSSYVFLQALPLLPNGKVDRGALPLLGAAPERPDTVTREPLNEIELLVAEVWRQVLNLESVGVDDNFFELGGHSLLAAEVAAKLRDAFGRQLSVRDVFDAPTVAGLAGTLERMFQEDGKEDLPPIRRAPGKANLPLSPGQAPLFVFSQLFGGGDFLNLPYAYRLDGRLDVAALRRSINEMIKRHAVLRTGFVELSSGPKQLVRRSAAVQLPFIDLARVSEQKREIKLEQISKRDAAQTFDLEKPPLMRIKLLRLAETQHILLVTLHHIIGDQWSMGVFRRDLAALYESFSQDLASPLADLPIQFADFASWQTETLKTGGFKGQIAYWQKQLGAPSPRLKVGSCKSKRPARYHSRRRAIDFDVGLLGRIKAFARERNCTPFMIFVAALNVLLHRYTGNTDIRVGTLVANRGRPGTAALIGYLVNALVLRARIRPDMTFSDLIDQVSETCVAAYAHQDLPFEHLEAVLEKRSRKDDGPLYQVMLNYRNQSTPTLEANGLTIASWDGTHRAADPGIAISRLDVNFHLRELSTKLTGAVNYKSDLFDDATIAKFVADYAAILEQMVAHPHERIADTTTGSCVGNL